MKNGRLGKGLALGGLGMAVLAMGLLVSGIAWAGGPGGKRCQMMEKHRAMLVEDLDLTEEQQAQLDGIHELIRSKHEAHEGERGEHFDQVLDAVESGEIDEQAVHDHIDAKVDEMRASLHEIADEVIVFVASLDEEQRATLVVKLEDFRERMERFHASGGPCGKGGPHGGPFGH